MICVPLKTKTVKLLMKQLKKAQRNADIIEVWFDELKGRLTSNDLKKIFQLKKKPFIYKASSGKKNPELLLKYPFEYIDLDIKTPDSEIKKIKKINPKLKLIISFHDFRITPTDKFLDKIAAKSISKGADIIKIATFANNFSDTLRMLNFLHRLSQEQKTICLCMGSEGKLTRTAGHLFGNYLTYAALDAKSKTAQGQLIISDLKKCL